MEQNATQKSTVRLLLNAEPFGFGPTAAMAGFFPHLRPHFEKIGYLGKKHTLDLQRGLPYDVIHDMTGAAKDDREESYRPVFSQYDVLFTAMDHKVAEEAKGAGLKVFYYDALAWYWPEIPESVRTCDLYIAQDFFGVKARLRDIFAHHAAAHTVSPIAPEPVGRQAKEHVLINLGGLQNPYWPVGDIVDYARTVITALRRAIPPSEKIVIAASQAVAFQLLEKGVCTYSRAEIAGILGRSKIAFMTPGLGNIYDAAAYNLPTAWLPPANDSQGRQLDLIDRFEMSDAMLEWRQIVPMEIDYQGAQPEVLSRIADAARRLTHDKTAQENLSNSASQLYNTLNGNASSSTAKLLDLFGRGGESQVARLVIDRVKGLGLG